MAKKPAASKATEPKPAAVDARDTLPEDFSLKLITGSPSEVSLQHPSFSHALVVNTSAVSALASRGRLLGPWVAWAWPLHSLWSPCPLPMVALRGA
jgi:hypothetical protein